MRKIHISLCSPFIIIIIIIIIIILTANWLPQGQLWAIINHPMLIIAFLHIQPEGHREPRNEIGSLSPAEHLVEFEPGTFRFLLQHLNPPSTLPNSLSKLG